MARTKVKKCPHCGWEGRTRRPRDSKIARDVRVLIDRNVAVRKVREDRRYFGVVVQAAITENA